MALIQFLMICGFVLVCWWCVRWLLKRFLSSKSWHRYVRWLVWFGFVGLFTFDTIYYQVVVVHGLCQDNQKRVYSAPPAEYVVAGPFSDEEIKKTHLTSDYLKASAIYHFGTWPCKDTASNKIGKCTIKNVIFEDFQQDLIFGKEDGVRWKDVSNNKTYSSVKHYQQNPQWLINKILSLGGIDFFGQPKECDSFSSIEQPIIFNSGENK
ncbi:MAG: hypothetical protein ACRCV6_05925 [Formosimonas sp.]